MKKKSITHIYVTSLFSLVLCMIMFLGTTMAWFTCEVQSGGHEIYVGSLGVDLLLQGVSLTNAENPPKIFSQEDKWAPNRVRIVTLQVENDGNLPFNYYMTLLPHSLTQIEAERVQENVTEEMMQVAALFEVYVTSGEVTGSQGIDDISGSDNWAKVGSLADILTNALTESPQKELYVFTGAMKADEEKHTYSVALYMKKDAGVEFMGEELNLSVKLAAYQSGAEMTEGSINFD